jgi:hypothetical protein
MPSRLRRDIGRVWRDSFSMYGARSAFRQLNREHPIDSILAGLERLGKIICRTSN